MSFCGGESGLTNSRDLLTRELLAWPGVKGVLIPPPDHLPGRVIGLVRHGVPSTGWHQGATVEEALAAGLRFLHELERLRAEGEVPP